MNLRVLSTALLLAGAILVQSACTNQANNKNHGPIVLGDSASIVTETNPENLVDQVQDLRPIVPTDEPVQSASTSGKDTSTATVLAAPVAPAPAPARNSSGLSIPFKEITIFIPGISTRSYGNANLQQARGASYELQSGNIAGNQMQFSGGKVGKITQRYQTILGLKDGEKTLPLESLGTYSSSWAVLTGNGTTYAIAGLEPAKLEAKTASAASIRNAVIVAARKQRLSRKDIDTWEAIARKVRSDNQPPVVTMLRSISWRIDGTDAAGKRFNKEVRMDMPR